MIYYNREGKLETFEEITKNAKLDFDVIQNPVYNEKGDIIKGYKRLTRIDNNIDLAIHKSSYNMTNHLEKMKEFDLMLGSAFSDNRIYSSAGSLKDGKIIFLSTKVPNLNDDKNVYFYYGGSYDGSMQDQYWQSLIKAICQNTFRMSIRENQGIYKVKHSKNNSERLENWKIYFKEILAYYNSFDRIMNELKQKQFTREKEEMFIKDLFGVKKEEKQIIPNGAIPWNEVSSKFQTPELEMVEISTRKENQIKKVFEVIETGKIEKEDLRHTGYGLIMGLSNYVTHHQNTRAKGEKDSQEKENSKEENKWYSIQFGSGNNLIQKGFEKLLEM